MSKEFLELKLSEQEDLIIYTTQEEFQEKVSLLKEVISIDTWDDEAEFNWEEYPQHVSDAVASFDGYYENGELYDFGTDTPKEKLDGGIAVMTVIEIPPSDTGVEDITVDYLKNATWL